MAKANIVIDQAGFRCSVCLDLLKDPVAIPCGHSFCKACINSYWNQEEQKGLYSCPQCRDTFTPRPVLRRNTMLAEVVEKLKKTEIQAAPPARHHAVPEDVNCDSCTGKKRKAVKSCLVCVASFCENHLKPHYQSPAFMKHTLIEASTKLQEKICSVHNKRIELYCRTDQSCICYLCTMDNHKGHDTVMAAAERAVKEGELREAQMKSQQRIQEKQEKVQELKQAVDTIKLSAQTAVENNEIIFTEMISYLENKRSEVTELIRAQKEAEVSRAERLLVQLEQEIADLQKKVSELEELSQTHDHIHFLQTLGSGHQSPILDRPEFDSSSIAVHQHVSFDEVRNSLSDLKKKVEDVCEEEFNKIASRDFCELTLDPNTAHRNLILSETNRVVRYSKKRQQYRDHPERFDSIWQVLCKENVCGRCYWEMERSGSGVVSLSVLYKDISRKGSGTECAFGRNDQSWSVWCSSSSVYFYHNNVYANPIPLSSSKIGVYVDHGAGMLLFYSVSDTVQLLYRVHTTFTQPLYAGIGFFSGSTVTLCDSESNV